MLLLLAGILFALHYVHLRADFPNYSPWIDWAKYTDEGWYGDAAIRHYLRGTWRLPGDFNPAVALPVWPLVEALLFRFTGVGIAAARALAVSVFGLCLICSYVLMILIPADGAHQPRTELDLRRVLGASALLLMAASPFFYAFTRMAILEPLLVLWVLLCLVAAYAVRLTQVPRRRDAAAVLVGVLAALMVGTKTTAIFLLPSVAYMMCRGLAWPRRQVARVVALAAGTLSALGIVYLALLIHFGYLQDFRYLFTANDYTGITAANFFQVVGDTVRSGMWIGSLLYPLTLLMILAVVFRRSVWRDPLFGSLVLWAGSYMVFMAYHANIQPRYYLVVAVPLTLLLVRGSLHLARWDRVVLLALPPVLLILTGYELRYTIPWMRHPQYSFVSAAQRVEKVVESDPAHSHTVLSISGSNLSLMTGLPSICDDFGTMQLEDRIAAYKPGWFVSWNYIEDDKMEALTKFYTLTRVAEFPAMDDPDRNLMIVYRLDAKPGMEPKRRRTRSGRS